MDYVNKCFHHHKLPPCLHTINPVCICLEQLLDASLTQFLATLAHGIQEAVHSDAAVVRHVFLVQTLEVRWYGV